MVLVKGEAWQSLLDEQRIGREQAGFETRLRWHGATQLCQVAYRWHYGQNRSA